MSRLFGNTRGVVVGTRAPAPAESQPKGFFDKLKNTVKEAKRSLQETFDGKPIEQDAQFFFSQQEFADFEKAILQLKKHVEEYIKAIKVLTQTQFHIASDLLFFYDKTHEHRSVGEEFLAAHQAFNSGDCNAVIERVTEEVVRPIDLLLGEFPAVREMVERRKTALADWNDAKREADHQRKKEQNNVKTLLKTGQAEEAEKAQEAAFNDLNESCLQLFNHYQTIRGPTIDRHFTSLYHIQQQFFEKGNGLTARLDAKMNSVSVASKQSRATISAPPPSFLSRELPKPKSDHEDAEARGLTPQAQQLLDRYRRRPVAAHPPPPQPMAAFDKSKKPMSQQTFSLRKSFAELHYSFNPFPNTFTPSAQKPPPPPPPTPSVKPKAPAAPTTVPIYKPPVPPAAQAAAAASMIATPAASFNPFPTPAPAAAPPPPPPATMGGAAVRRAAPPTPAANRPAPPPPSGPRPSANFAGQSSLLPAHNKQQQPPPASASSPVSPSSAVTAAAAAAAGSPVPPVRPNRAPTALKNAVRRVVATGAAAASAPTPARAVVVHHGAAAGSGHTPPAAAAAPIASASPARAQPNASPALGAAASPLSAVGEDAPLDGAAAAGAGAGAGAGGEDDPVDDAVDGELGGSLSQGRSRANGAALVRAEASDSVASKTATPTTYVTALYEYAAQRAVELSFSAGDRLWVIEKDADSGWWYGMNDQYESGYFPSNYTDMNEQATAEGAS